MTVAFPLRYKREAFPRCRHCQVLHAFELESVIALFTPPVSFWPTHHQPIFIVCFAPRRASCPAVFVDNLQKKLRIRPREETQPASPTMAPFLEMFESLRLTLVGMYLCIADGICLLLVFHVHIHHSLPHELR
jgi:hypothetical protein